jgi:hypothetical protein
MKMVRFRFANESDVARGFVGLAKRVQLYCFPNDEFELAQRDLWMLDELEIPYEVVRTEGFDHAYREIRGPAAHPA